MQNAQTINKQNFGKIVDSLTEQVIKT